MNDKIGLLKGELLRSHIGGFHIRSPQGLPIIIQSDPYQIRLCDISSGQPVVTDEVIISLEDQHRLDLIRISIDTVMEQIHHYTADDYQELIRDLINPDGISSPDELYRLENGSILMKNEADRLIPQYCESLKQALSIGANSFFQSFVKVLDDLCEGIAADWSNTTVENFLQVAIKQLPCEHPEGWLMHDHAGDEIQDPDTSWMSSIPSTDLEAYWLRRILDEMWYGEIELQAYKAHTLKRNVPNMILNLSSARMPEIIDGTNLYEIKKDGLWLDFGGSLTAGLSTNLVKKVLEHHDQALIIDLIKLFTTLWNERPDVQRSRMVDIPDRWEGLVEMLHLRYDTASSSKKMLTKTKNACRLLESIRWGSGWDDHVKLMSFEGLARNRQLTATYHAGFYDPLSKSERLVPILDHPKGKTNTRAYYNRLGLALGMWLVDNSQSYLASNGLGVKLDDKGYQYLMEHAGFPRRNRVDSALEAFEDHGAIKRHQSSEGDFIGLGELNLEGERLIIEGAKISKRASQRGRRSANKRRKLRLGKKT
jgi:hypothetical protein